MALVLLARNESSSCSLVSKLVNPTFFISVQTSKSLRSSVAPTAVRQGWHGNASF
jgi:hypothetical protein